MPQMHFYVSEEIAQKVKHEALAAKMSVSRYIAQIIKRQFTGTWPENFFDEIVGKWQGEPMQQPEMGIYEQREAFSPDEKAV